MVLLIHPVVVVITQMDEVLLPEIEIIPTIDLLMRVGIVEVVMVGTEDTITLRDRPRLHTVMVTENTMVIDMVEDHHRRKTVVTWITHLDNVVLLHHPTIIDHKVHHRVLMSMVTPEVLLPTIHGILLAMDHLLQTHLPTLLPVAQTTTEAIHGMHTTAPLLTLNQMIQTRITTQVEDLSAIEDHDKSTVHQVSPVLYPIPLQKVA
mmetsp:Transcript_20619/g.30627  ORF Transcript_20619/g.30627 Transcript_20619/m.30627 type:complete len:206 (+) Transcript_20619:1375-1992(+)